MTGERRSRERLLASDEEPRLERVVVGMDFQPSSLNALQWTRTVLAPGADLVVVHALDGGAPSSSLATSPEPPEAALAAALEDAGSRLRTLIDALGMPAARAVVRADSGGGPVVVATVAEESGADVIVVGTRGPGTPASSRLGSTAERLIRISPVPVLLAADGPRSRPARILVPVDESELTSPVLAWTALLAGLWGASVTLLHVVTPVAAPAVADATRTEGTPAESGRRPTLDVLRDDAEHWLASLAGELRRPAAAHPPGVTTEVATITDGTAGDAVLAAAARQRADMIVMGRRGAGRVFSGLIGSTASTVLRGADCPVLVVVDPPFALVDVW